MLAVVIDFGGLFSTFPTFIVSCLVFALLIVLIDKVAKLISHERSSGNVLFQDVRSPLLQVLRPEIVVVLMIALLFFVLPRLL
jgi:hypothetical protein